MIDYRELLKKYMNTVGEEEGVYFINTWDFTSKEVEELESIIEEINNEYEQKI